jgi:threonine synthase
VHRRPRLDTFQTNSAWPLRRAYEAVTLHGFPSGIAYAAAHRHEFMWPWETTPHSIAHGILDDETYDWLAVVEGMLATGGVPIVAGEAALAEANAIAREATGIAVDPTGSSGLAGLLALRDARRVADDDRVGVLFTGVDRTALTYEKGAEDAQLSGTGHPVAQGIRAV